MARRAPAKPLTPKALFALGHIVATPAAIALAGACGVAIAALLSRHVTGEWGDTCPEDGRMNDRAARMGGQRIVSSYKIDPSGKHRLWIITEADRSSTCVLLPDED